MSSQIVLKFGGSSMCPIGYKTMYNETLYYDENNTTVIIVVSAIQKTTNMLFKIIESHDISINMEQYQIIRENHLKLCHELDLDTTILMNMFKELETDIIAMNELKNTYGTEVTQYKISILSYGEIFSSIILHEYLNKNKVSNKLINARDFIMATNLSTDIDFYTLNIDGEFRCDKDKITNLYEEEVNIYVTQGFIASTGDNKYCILSRSGSDTSASIIASGIDATKLEIWTDVNGMYTADPRIVPNAKLIREISYEVSQELSTAGSRVLHPYCIKPCEEKNIPIFIKNTFDPCAQYTEVTTNTFSGSSNMIYSIALQNNITVYDIESINIWGKHGASMDIFAVFSKFNIDLNIINTSYKSISTTTDEQSIEKKKFVFDELIKKYNVKMISNCCIVSIIADNVKHNDRLKETLSYFKEFRKSSLHMVHYSATDLNLSFVVDNDIAIKLIRFLHNKFFI